MICSTCGEPLADGETYRWVQKRNGQVYYHTACAPKDSKEAKA